MSSKSTFSEEKFGNIENPEAENLDKQINELMTKVHELGDKLKAIQDNCQQHYFQLCIPDEKIDIELGIETYRCKHCGKFFLFPGLI